MELQYSEQRLEQLKAYVGDDGTPADPPPAPVLEILADIAKTGLICYPWPLVRAALIAKLDQTIDAYITGFADCAKESLEARRTIIRNGLGIFLHAPFTLQRLTEIALQLPGSSYSTTQKLLNAIEKLTRVSTMEPSLSKEEYEYEVAKLVAAEEELGEDEPSTPMEVDEGSPEHTAEEIACIDETMEDVEPPN